MQDKFSNILDKGETIQISFLPNKKKRYFINLLVSTLILVFVCGLTAIAMFIPEEGSQALDGKYAIIPIGVFVLGIGISLLFSRLWLKHTFYVLTNKRAIIRTGIIGVDFKSLDLKTICATDVYVSVFDKLLGGKTGSIRMGSMASPINSTNGMPYAFSHINDPYVAYKKIKEILEQAQNNQ